MLSEKFENMRRTLVRFGEQLYGLPIDTVDFIGKKVKMRSGSYGIIRSLEEVERDLLFRQVIQIYSDSGCPQLVFVYEDKKPRYQVRSLDPLELFKADPSVTDLERFVTQINGLKVGNTLMIGLSKLEEMDWKINFDDVHLIPDSPEILYYTPNQLERIRRKEPISWEKGQIKQEDEHNNIGDEYIGYEGEYEK